MNSTNENQQSHKQKLIFKEPQKEKNQLKNEYQSQQLAPTLSESQIHIREDDLSLQQTQTAMLTEEDGAEDARALGIKIKKVPFSIPEQLTQSMYYEVTSVYGNILKVTITQSNFSKSYTGAHVETHPIPRATHGEKGKMMIMDTITGERIERLWRCNVIVKHSTKENSFWGKLLNSVRSLFHS